MKAQELLAERDEYARQLASARFRLTNLVETIEQDEKILKSHRTMQLDAACEAAALEALVREFDDQLLELAQEGASDVTTDEARAGTDVD